jgi:hypothetical protein
MTDRSNMQHKSKQLPATVPQHVYPEDEINLIDLWLIITKHKKVFWYVFATILVLSLIVGLIFPKKYTLSSTISIGQVTQNNKTTYLESPETVKAKLQNALIPEILNQYDDEDIRAQKFEVSTPKNSDLVLIKTKVTKDEVEKFSMILNEMTDAIEIDHERIMLPIVASINADINKKQIELKMEKDERFIEPIIKNKDVQLTDATVELKRLEDPTIYEYRKQSLEIELQNEIDILAALKEKEDFLKKKKERLNRLNDLLVNQIKELKDQIATSMELKKNSALKTSVISQGMEMLMIDNELQQNRTRLAELEERLYIDLENQHSELNTKINENSREQVRQNALINEKEQNIEMFEIENQMEIDKQKSEIAKIEAEKIEIPALREKKVEGLSQDIIILKEELSNQIDTRAISKPLRSEEPASLSNKIIMLVGIFVAFIMGLFATFIAEFANKVSMSRESQA